jgi:O-methyltransferase
MLRQKLEARRILWSDAKALIQFVFSTCPFLSLKERYRLAHRLVTISQQVDCPHTESEVLAFIQTILSLDESMIGCIVEAGCYKGGSTAKFSIATHATNRTLVVFDSFEGLPSHSEPHKYTIFGRPVTFSAGEYRGSLDEVRSNIKRFGELQVCRFVEGWFDATMPKFKEPIAAIYLDVDLVESTRTCLKYLYPLLQVGGKLYSQDGHLPLVLEVFEDERFWQEEVGVSKPYMHGLGTSKLITIVKTS